MTKRRSIRQALSDPGSFVDRRHDVGPENDETETLVEWQARAVATWLREEADSQAGILVAAASRTLRQLADKIDRRES